MGPEQMCCLTTGAVETSVTVKYVAAYAGAIEYVMGSGVSIFTVRHRPAGGLICM